MSRIDEINAILDSLGSGGTYEQFEYALRDYPQRELISVLADRAAAGGGGAAPITCLLARDAAIPDIHDAGDNAILWDALYDDLWSFNTLGAIPAGLGMTFAFDGSDEAVTTTEPGVWALTWSLDKGGDATWTGALNTGLGQHAYFGDSTFITVVSALPAAAVLTNVLTTATPSTADPYPLNSAYLAITRLG